jgi:heme exporter protein D
MDLGPHAVFIWAAYGAVAAVIGLLIGWLVWDGRRQQRELMGLEAEAGRRRGGRS